MIDASVSANGASPVDSPFEPIQKPSSAASFQPVTQLVAIGCRGQDQQRQDRHVRLHEFDQGIATAGRSAPRFAAAGIRGNGRNSSRIRASNASTSDPVAVRRYLGGLNLASAACIVFGEHPTTPGCRRHV